MFKGIVFVSLVIIVCSCQGKQRKSASELVGKSEPGTKAISQDPLKESMERGGIVYTDFCMQCHLADGKGVPGSFPPLAASNWLRDKREESIHAIKYGQRGEIEVNGKTYNGVMVPMGLSDQEVADVMNYIMNRWGNTQDDMVTEEEVARIEK